MNKLTGVDLLNKVRSINPTFESGPPWKGKEDIVKACGYFSQKSTGLIQLHCQEFHEAFENARIFSELIKDEDDLGPEEIALLFHLYLTAKEGCILEDIDECIRNDGISILYDFQDELI